MSGGKMTLRKDRRDGVSMLYVMAALIVTGFIGTAMVKLVASEQFSNALYAGSNAARQSAKSGLMAAVYRFESTLETDATIDLLQDWIDAETNSPLQWVSEHTELDYTTKLIAFDSENFNVTLRSDGYGRSGSRASATAVYHLDGLEYQTVIKKKSYPQNAIHLDGNDQFEMNCSLVVHGPTYLGGDFAINNKSCVFDGPFVQKNQHSVVGKNVMNRGATFRGKTYLGFETEVFNGNNLQQCRFLDSVGFGKKFTSYAPGSFTGGNVWSNGNLYFSSASMNSARFDYYSGITLSGISDIGTMKDYSEKIVITDKMNIASDIYPSVFFNRDSCMAHVNYTRKVACWDGIKLSGSMLNGWYESLSASQLWGGEYMVVHAKAEGWDDAFVKDEPFKYKMILLLEEYGGAPNLRFFPESTRPVYDGPGNLVTEGSEILLYVNGATITNANMGPVDYFRGLIYVDGSGGEVGLNLVADETYIDGAVYHSDGAKHYYINNGDAASPQLIDITYNEELMKQFDALGVFTNPTADPEETSEKVLQLNPSYNTINAVLLSQCL